MSLSGAFIGCLGPASVLSTLLQCVEACLATAACNACRWIPGAIPLLAQGQQMMTFQPAVDSAMKTTHTSPTFIACMHHACQRQASMACASPQQAQKHSTENHPLIHRQRILLEHSTGSTVAQRTRKARLPGMATGGT